MAGNGGITSVTLSTKRQSVTLTPETFERAGKLARALGGGRGGGGSRKKRTSGAAGIRVVEGKDEEAPSVTAGAVTPPPSGPGEGLEGAEVKVEPVVRVTRVKRDATRVIIEWERQRADGRGAAGAADDSEPGKVSEGFDALSMKCADEPARSFDDAMVAVAQLAVSEIGFGLIRERVRFGSVSFSWARDIMGATVTGRVNVPRRQAPLILTVPHAPSEPYADGGDPEMCLGEELTAALWTLHAEALAYVEGRRRQLGLFDREEEEKSSHRRGAPREDAEEGGGEESEE